MMKSFVGSQQSDTAKFIGAATVFDLCFNTPVNIYQHRVLSQIVAKLTDRKAVY